MDPELGVHWDNGWGTLGHLQNVSFPHGFYHYLMSLNLFKHQFLFGAQ